MTKTARQTILDRVHRDPKFRLEFLKELTRQAVKADPDLMEKVMKVLDDKKK
jgi:hypothetical protein